MDLDTIMDGADRFAAYVEELTSVIGHPSGLHRGRTALVDGPGSFRHLPRAVFHGRVRPRKLGFPAIGSIPKS
jgi:hypothetical protein